MSLIVLPLLVFASQVLDGATFLMVFENGGQELNPVANQLGTFYGLGGILLIKFGIAVVALIVALQLRQRRKLLIAVTTLGIVGAYSNLLGLL
jgi:hypothetical protein